VRAGAFARAAAAGRRAGSACTRDIDRGRRRNQPPAVPQKKAKVLGAVAVHGRFISNAGESAMKLNVPVRDTPYSISSYSQSFMNAIEVHKVSDLYSYMTGIQSAGVTGYDITFRGFTAGANDQNTILIDGLPGLATRFGSPVTIGISRIEVVRGPASVANGQEQPGGFIDLITKKPEDQPFYEFSASGAGYAGHGIGAGSKLGGDFAADLTGPLDKSGRFLYRVIVDDSNRDGFRTDTYNRSIYFAPTRHLAHQQPHHGHTAVRLPAPALQL
jgi:Outer membrane receptor for ferric coprogen and ferric-rhodotorulic acid